MAAVFKSYSFFVVGVLFFLKSMFILQTGVHVVLVLMAYSLEHQWYRSIHYLPLAFPRPLCRLERCTPQCLPTLISIFLLTF